MTKKYIYMHAKKEYGTFESIKTKTKEF